MTLLMNRYAEELCLIDVNENALDNHIMDLENAFPDQTIYRGTYEDLRRSSIVIITAGVPIEINQDGIQRIIEWDLSNTENQAFQQSVHKIKTIIEENDSVFH